MSPMRRHTRTRRLSIAAIASLLLFFATAALWVRSYSMFYTELRQRAHVEGQQIDFDTDALRACDGSLYFHHEITQLPFNPAVKISPNAAKQLLGSQGSSYAFMRQTPWNGANWPDDPNRWRVPLWIPLLLLLITPMRWLIARSENTLAFPVITKHH